MTIYNAILSEVSSVSFSNYFSSWNEIEADQIEGYYFSIGDIFFFLPLSLPILIFSWFFIFQKRVLFLGQKTSVNDICSMVLAAAAMVSDPLSSVISRRVFPYVCLHHVEVLQRWGSFFVLKCSFPLFFVWKVSFLSLLLSSSPSSPFLLLVLGSDDGRPGCIAGIANPMAEQRDSWWDLLCKVDTGEVIRSPVVLWDDEFDSRDYDEEFFTQVRYLLLPFLSISSFLSLF